jgi:copper chaperone CopZ
MHCTACESAVQQALAETPAQVEHIDHQSGEAVVAFSEAEISKAQLVRYVQQTPYRVSAMEEVG